MASTKAVSLVPKWYSVSYKSMTDTLKTLKELIQDEPEAKLEPTPFRNHAYIFTGLPWEFLRESLPEAIVGISDLKNRLEAERGNHHNA